MNERFTRNPDGSVTLTREVTITVASGTSMYDAETALMQKINEAGCDLTGDLMASRDAPGEPLEIGGVRYTAKKRKEKRCIETPYGCTVAECWAYQSAAGGACVYPLVRNASLIGAATPKFARMITRKMTELPAGTVADDLVRNHERKISVAFIQDLSDLTGRLAESTVPDFTKGELPPPEAVKIITVSIDGATLRMGWSNATGGSDARKQRAADWRVAMVGAITLYSDKGERLGTIYSATGPPENKDDGKTAFWALMDKEVAIIKARYPNARYVGISDGATDFVPWLRQHTSELVLDFFHAASYLHAAAGAFAHEVPNGEVPNWWSHEACSFLKHGRGAAAALLTAMTERLADTRSLTTADHEALTSAIRYFTNNTERMDYHRYVEEKLPIGSGVTEAVCKLLVKKRFCGPGMKWSFTAAARLLNLRAIAQSAGERWDALWTEILTKKSALLT
jgi:hypothetical protein